MELYYVTKEKQVSTLGRVPRVSKAFCLTGIPSLYHREGEPHQCRRLINLKKQRLEFGKPIQARIWKAMYMRGVRGGRCGRGMTGNGVMMLEVA